MMAEEELVTSAEAVPTAAAADYHKRKLGDLGPLADSDSVAAEEENGSAAADESDAKRQRLEDNEDGDLEKTDGEAAVNGYQGEEKTDKDTKEGEAADINVQPESVQEAAVEHVIVISEIPISVENEKPESESAPEEWEPPKSEVEEPTQEVAKEADVPSAESDSNPTTRRIEVPNDKVGVLIGKAGDTIRSLQDNSGAKIQIMRDAEADPNAPTRPVELIGTHESINKAEKLIKDVIAEADAGGSPSLVARGFNTVQAAGGGEQLEIQVPFEKVGIIIGKGGETIRNLQTRSGARIQLIQQNQSEGEQSKERTVRITGNKKQIDTAREMIRDVMNQTARPSPLSGGYSQQGFRPRGSGGPQWGGPRGPYNVGYDYPPRGPYPSHTSQYPHQPYGNYPPQQPPRSNFGPSWEQRPPAMHGHSPQVNYNYPQQRGPEYGQPTPYSQPPAQNYGPPYEAKYDHHAAPQQYGQQQPYAQGPPPHTGYGAQDQYGKPPMYGAPSQAPHHSQPYGQPRPNQPGEAQPYQAPVSSAPTYGQNVPSQQPYPYASTAPAQQNYPPYGSAPAADGYSHPPATAGYPQSGQPVAGYGQQQPQTYPQAGPTGAYGSYATAQGGYAEQPPAGGVPYGYQAPADPAAYGAAQGAAASYAPAAAGQAGYAQPAPVQPAYDQSGAYGGVPAAQYGKSVSPQAQPQVPGQPQQAAYPQYDASQMYGAHR